METQPAPLSEDQLDAIEARANAATPGPWRDADTHLGRHGHTATVLSGTGNDTDLRAWLPSLSQEAGDETRNVWADAAFIAAARTDVPALVAEVRRLRTELADARAQGIADAAAWLHEAGEREAAYLLRTVDVPAAEETHAQLPGGFKRTTAVTVDCAACGYHFDETEFIHAFDSVEEAVDTVVGAGWDELKDGRVVCEDQDEKHEALRSEVGIVNDSEEA